MLNSDSDYHVANCWQMLVFGTLLETSGWSSQGACRHVLPHAGRI